jgi:purine nucleosidase
MTPILLDTDIGSDIDDAVALAYLLKQPECELLGVTTVTGDTVKRAALAEILLREADRGDVPVYAGLRSPLLHGPGQPDVPQYEAVSHRPHAPAYGNSPADAVLFLRETIRARPGQVTLLAIGPLTNIAALFALDPEIPNLLGRLVLMCGVYGAGAAGQRAVGAREWNALVDPVATSVVYRGAVPGKFTAIGLDVTEKCRLPAAECRMRFARAGGPLAIVADMAEVWFRNVPHITFHDPLAAAWIFQPALGAEAAGTVTVHSADDGLAGLTAWSTASGGPHRVAADVDPDAFFAHFFGVVGG